MGRRLVTNTPQPSVCPGTVSAEWVSFSRPVGLVAVFPASVRWSELYFRYFHLMIRRLSGLISERLLVGWR